MPYLQLDVSDHFPVEVKRRLARQLGDIYARIMQTKPDAVTIAFRELGEGGVWRCSDGEPEPGAVLTCDIRLGRPPEQRAELARALVEACAEALGLRANQIDVEFTQHAGDEFFRVGLGLINDWTPAEAQTASRPAPA